MDRQPFPAPGPADAEGSLGALLRRGAAPFPRTLAGGIGSVPPGQGPVRRPGHGRTLRRALARRRRLLAAGLAAAAVAVGLPVLAPPDPVTVPVTVAASDLPAGRFLTGSDTTIERWPAENLPSGLLPAPEGRRLASPLRRGEPVTDARLTGEGLLTGQSRNVLALPVRLADPASAELVRTGDRVDVLAGDPQDTPVPSERAALLAEGVLVLATGAPVPDAGSPAAPGAVASEAHGGVLSPLPAQEAPVTGSIVLAVSRDAAARLAAAAGTRPLSVAVRAGP